MALSKLLNGLVKVFTCISRLLPNAKLKFDQDFELNSFVAKFVRLKYLTSFNFEQLIPLGEIFFFIFSTNVGGEATVMLPASVEWQTMSRLHQGLFQDLVVLHD